MGNIPFSFSPLQYNQEYILPNVFSGKLSENYHKSILIPGRMVASYKVYYYMENVYFYQIQ